MSTDHQKYSTENQADAIRKYAASRGMEVVRTYADSGKSGLKFEGRDALKQLIDDVQSGKPSFSVILVYDISRWGRFQDADESAYYEYICRRAGISVQYCAEQFDNDGSPISTIVKGVKRAMAGEYSRELSAKVFAGQGRLIEKGYRQGGAAGFGLRRMLLDQNGTPKGTLRYGEHKSIQTDRVVLTLGPDEEVDIVRKIFNSFVTDRLTEREIAADLNRKNILTDKGRPWSRGSVHQILINEKYVGDNVWNRRSFKLKKKRVRNSPDMWIRSLGVFPNIVDRHLFEAARAIISARSFRLSDEQMLAALKELFAQRGMLSGFIIDEHDGVPSSSAYSSRFGSLLRAYELVGYTPERDYKYVAINRRLHALHPEVMQIIKNGLQTHRSEVEIIPDSACLMVNGEFSVSVVISRCFTTLSGSSRWKVRFNLGALADLNVVVRMDTQNRSPHDYYILPRIDLVAEKLRLADENGISLDAYRCDTLEYLFEMSAPAHLMEVA
jgi:DNA invertase Pin-like site-specific DNA recombinase